MTNENIYSSLQVVLDSNVSQLKTQSQEKDFGVAGQIFSNSVGAAGAYSQEKIKVLFDTSDKLGKQVGSRLIKVNFGIFNILYKKLEQKSNEKIAKELLIEGATGYVVTKSVATSFAIKQVAKETGKKITIRTGVGIIGRVFTGIGIGAIAGSEIPIVGTIIGAVVGGIAAGFINDWIFGDEDEELKKQEAKEKYLEEKLDEKMHKIINYLITHQYIELRVLNEDEAEKLCKEISDINSAYFKTILLMLSFPYYLDKDEQSYKKAQEKNPTIIRIQPIANALNIKIEINECFLAKNGEALKNKEIYVYNHRFNRVVAKAMSDDEGKIVFENVYVGKESTIDKISFIIDRENFNEDNFYESVLKYAPMFNIQKKHKQKGQAFIDKMFFSFTYAQGIMQDNEVLKLEALKNNFNIVFDYEVRKQEESYKNYIILSYLVFDVKEDIEEYIRHTTIENRAFRGLELLGRGWKNQYSIKDEWRDKGVVFFAYFNSQKFTPYKKMAFIDKPIVILDIEKFDKEDILKDIKFHFKTLTKAYKIFVIDLDANTQIQEKKSIVNNIKKNTQNLELLYLQLKLFDDKDANKCKVQYFHNENKYANQEMKWIEYCKKQLFSLNSENPIHKNKNSFDMEVPFVSISFGSLIYDKERLAKKGVRQIFGVRLAESCRRYFYEK
ncbi:hypothetical protein C3H71_09250 [Campylobacter jejuni]|uniref:hypothetical protein n=3 Tax=Campylobacter jejuni TaxID=197 RepID=UPI000F80B3A7|nr:hypothetical protein [Campylobacter jejuni]RTJ49938.1 hypothetical protein C3H71_09250 [Campylobacter jejuni]